MLAPAFLQKLNSCIPSISDSSSNSYRHLYMARANPSIGDMDDRTPIYLAAERGHTEIVDILADKFKVGSVVLVVQHL